MNKTDDTVLLSAFGPEGPLVLAVDDSIENLNLVEEILKIPKYRVRKVMSGYEALEIIKSETVDLVLLDVMMPGLDGFQVLNAIRSRKSQDYVPVILVTALNSIEDKEHAELCGADDFISKPFTPKELIVRVRSMLKIRALNIELNKAKEQLKEANIRLKMDNLRLEKEVSYLQEKFKYSIEPEKGLNVVFAENKCEIELHPQTINIFFEKKPFKSMEVFLTNLARGRSGTYISRTIPSAIRNKYHLETTNILWLTSNRIPDEVCVDPSNIGRVSAYISGYLADAKNGIVFLDGLEYIISKNDFKTTLNFLALIHDKLMVSTSQMILSFDPLTMTNHEVRQIAKEGVVGFEEENK
ncbi:MAG: response regulator [Thermoplasmata archaeon]